MALVGIQVNKNLLGALKERDLMKAISEQTQGARSWLKRTHPGQKSYGEAIMRGDCNRTYLEFGTLLVENI